MTLDRRCITGTLVSFAGLAMPIVTSATAHASPIAAGGGLEYAHGAGDELTRTGHAFVSGRLPWAALTMAGARFDGSAVGAGGAGIAGLALAMGAGASWQAWAARFVGDGSFRAWRIKTGPEWTAGDGRSLGLSLLHWEDNLGGRANGAVAELGVPVNARLQARFTGGYSAPANSDGAAQGTAGLAWTPLHALELSGDVGLANGAMPGSGFAPATPGPGRGRPQLPILGDPDVGNSAVIADRVSSTDFTFTLGVRVVLP